MPELVAAVDWRETARTLQAEVTRLRAAVLVLPLPTVEWALQHQPLIDGPFDGDIDDGSLWSDRFGRKYTEEEATEAQARRRYFRLMTRTVHYGPWRVADHE